MLLTMILYVLINMFFPFYNLSEENISSHSWYGILIYSLLIMIIQLGIYHIAHLFTHHKKEQDYQEALHFGIKNILPFLGLQIILGVFITGLSLLLLVPGIIYAVYWVFAPYAFIAHGKTGMEALRYSKSLVQDNWWRVFGMLLLISIIITVLFGIFTVIFAIVLSIFSLPSDHFISTFLFQICYIPLSLYSYLLIFYSGSLLEQEKKSQLS